MISLALRPRLTKPSLAVKTSYLVGEQADMLHRGADTSWLSAASLDFNAFVAERTGVRERWGVPSELFWFTSGDYYIGSLVLRHRLTDDEGGGHIGYHVVYPWQRQGHATAMLLEGMERARAVGIERVLLTVAPDNDASRKIVERQGGVADGLNHESEMRFWLDKQVGAPTP